MTDLGLTPCYLLLTPCLLPTTPINLPQPPPFALAARCQEESSWPKTETFFFTNIPFKISLFINSSAFSFKYAKDKIYLYLIITQDVIKLQSQKAILSSVLFSQKHCFYSLIDMLLPYNSIFVRVLNGVFWRLISLFFALKTLFSGKIAPCFHPPGLLFFFQNENGKGLFLGLFLVKIIEVFGLYPLHVTLFLDVLPVSPISRF